MKRMIYNMIWLSIAVSIALGVVYLIMQKTGTNKGKPLNILPESWEDYFPLQQGMEWRYSYAMNAKGEKFRDELITKVTAVVDNNVFVESGPKKLVYIKSKDGVRYKGSENFIIKNPIKENNSWSIILGGLKGRMKIIKTNDKITIKGKTYVPCIVLEKAIKDKDEMLVMRAWYAKGIGLVKMDSYSLKPNGDKEVLVAAELEEFKK